MGSGVCPLSPKLWKPTFQQVKSQIFFFLTAFITPTFIIYINDKMVFSECLLVNLSKFITTPILCDWLEVESVAKLDTAVCNKFCRSHLLTLFASSVAVFSCYDSNVPGNKKCLDSNAIYDCQNEWFKWMTLREISIKSLSLWHFDTTDCIDLLTNRLSELSLSKITSAHLSEFSEGFNHTIFLKLSTLCPRLTSLHLHSFGRAEIPTLSAEFFFPCVSHLTVEASCLHKNCVIDLIRSCPSLEYISLKSSTFFEDYHNDDDGNKEEVAVSRVVRAIAEHCPLLTEFDFEGVRDISNAALITLIKSHPNLTSVIMGVGMNCEDRDEVYLVLAETCPLLQHLIVSSPCGEYLTDVSISEIAFNCPELVTFNVGNCDELTDKSLGLIAKHCTKLKTFKIHEECVSYHSICAIMTNCKSIVEIHAPGLVNCDFTLQSTVHYNHSFDGLVCTDLRTIDISGSDYGVHIDLFKCIADYAPNLTALHMSDCGHVIMEDAAFICLITECNQLKCLEMSGCPLLTPKSMKAIILNLTQLEILDIQWCNIATVGSVKKLLSTCGQMTALSWSFYTIYEPKNALEALREEYPELEMTCGRGSVEEQFHYDLRMRKRGLKYGV